MSWNISMSAEREAARREREKPDIVRHAEKLAANDRKYGRDNPKNPNNKPNGKY
jgi:hypothetical protein